MTGVYWKYSDSLSQLSCQDLITTGYLSLIHIYRVVISQSGTVEETNHYYPFGGAVASTSNVQPYKYNGKELDSKKGLNWYDYGARHYDAALGRFTTNDRFAEKYYSCLLYTSRCV